MRIVEAVAALLAVVTTAGAGGVYLGFSAMVMPALHGSRAAAPTMNLINERATRSSFMVVFLGSVVTCVVAGALAATRLPQLGAVLTLVGAVAGVVAFAVTAAVNVPLNNRLAAAPTDDGYALFEQGWRRANAWRGAVSFAGALLIGAGLAL